jgi:hypothetical protein
MGRIANAVTALVCLGAVVVPPHSGRFIWIELALLLLLSANICMALMPKDPK